jgi:hypothetical protein
MKNKLIDIKRIVEKQTGYRIDIKDRRREVTYARAVYCKVARSLTPDGRPISLASIGEVINRDHASVLHNVRVIFPFAVKERNMDLLYKTLLTMFNRPDEIDNFDEVADLSERLIELQKENDALRHKLLLVNNQVSEFDSLTQGLSEEEMKEVYERLDVMVRSIRGRVYQ